MTVGEGRRAAFRSHAGSEADAACVPLGAVLETEKSGPRQPERG